MRAGGGSSSSAAVAAAGATGADLAPAAAVEFSEGAAFDWVAGPAVPSDPPSAGKDATPRAEASAPFQLRLPPAGLAIKRGELVAVVGGVGSGKSTMISAMLGEVPPVAGSCAVRAPLAYVDPHQGSTKVVLG